MLRHLRDAERGGPAVRARLLAAVVLVGLLALSTPTVIVLVRWLVGLVI